MGKLHIEQISRYTIHSEGCRQIYCVPYSGKINSKNEIAEISEIFGYKMCEAYFNMQTDKRKAILDILNIEDLFYS